MPPLTHAAIGTQQLSSSSNSLQTCINLCSAEFEKSVSTFSSPSCLHSSSCMKSLYIWKFEVRVQISTKTSCLLINTSQGNRVYVLLQIMLQIKKNYKLKVSNPRDENEWLSCRHPLQYRPQGVKLSQSRQGLKLLQYRHQRVKNCPTVKSDVRANVPFPLFKCNNRTGGKSSPALAPKGYKNLSQSGS